MTRSGSGNRYGAMVERYEVTDPKEVLTDDVVEYLRLVFRHYGLAIREVHVKLADRDWQPFPLPPPPPPAQDSPLCSYLRCTEPFAELCVTADRASCCELAMQQPDKPVLWHCPFGLRELGIGFRVARAEIVLRSGDYLEAGDEGLAIRKTLKMLDSHKLGHLRNELLGLLKKQPSRTDSEVWREAESLAALVKLVRNEARAKYERNLERSKEDFIQTVSRRIVPLMTGFTEYERNRLIQEVLGEVVSFFELQACSFYFANADVPEPLALLADRQSSGSPIDPKRLYALLFDQKDPHVGIAQHLTTSDLLQLPGKPSVGCLITYPGNNAGLLAVTLLPDKPLWLDETSLARVTRTLSIPICVASLQAGLQREAEQRRIQARDTAHTVRSVFQGVEGDVQDIRDVLTAAMPDLSASLKEPLEHMEELIGFMSDLLASQDFVLPAQFQKGLRPARLSDKRLVRICHVVTRARDSFQKRCAARFIDIVIHPGVQHLPPVPMDDKVMLLVFVHLLHNALKYSHAGSPDKRRTIDVKGWQGLTKTYVDVADYGLGIHPAEEQTIFEPYVQGSVEDKTRPISGQGIGLAAARAIARLHGGDVVLKRCIAYDRMGGTVPRDTLMLYRPDSGAAADLLQHCLVVFEVFLPKS